MQHVAIFGGTSAIAVEVARLMAKAGDKVFLVARDAKKLAVVEADLKARGAGFIGAATADLNAFESHSRLLAQAREQLGDLDVVLIAHGTLPDQAACEADFVEAEEAIRTNFLSAASLASAAAKIMAPLKRGTIAVIGSVAGDRGRQSNFVYGSAKAGLAAYLQGLRNRLAHQGVHVVTIKPGMVDTPMTAHMKKGPLFASAEDVGQGIYRAILKKRNVVYVPALWILIMGIIKSIPEAIFKKLKL